MRGSSTCASLKATTPLGSYRPLSLLTPCDVDPPPKHHLSS
jgi:hypothetical protein